MQFNSKQQQHVNDKQPNKTQNEIKRKQTQLLSADDMVQEQIIAQTNNTDWSAHELILKFRVSVNQHFLRT